jgi:hypothetical protein
MRLPTYQEHRRFVEVEGWQDKDKASLKRKGDHHRYTLTLANGDMLYTRVSHGRGQYRNPGMFAHILRDELRVSEEDFWRCVDDGVSPPRPEPATPTPPKEALDAKLARNLIRKVGLTQAQVAAMSEGEAVAAWNAYLASGGDPPAR